MTHDSGPRGDARRKPWTVMIYMVADDPQGGELLDQAANRELDDIVHATLGPHRDNVHVAVQVDFRCQPDVWRRIVGEGTWIQPESNAASPGTLYGFFDWVAGRCPAHRHMLIMWGHSRSLFGLFTDTEHDLVGLFADADPFAYMAQTLTLTELSAALEAARTCLHKEIDIVAFKDCFMSTLETAYELTGLARFMIASQELVPVERWPYAGIFGALDPVRDVKDVAIAVTEQIRRHYADHEENRVIAGKVRPEIPFALLDTDAVDSLTAPLDALVGQIRKGGTKPNGGARPLPPKAVMKELALSSRGDPALADLVDVCRTLRGKTGEMAAAAAALDAAALRVIVEPRRNGKSRNGQFGGVSVFMNPSGPERRKSKVLPLASANAYRSLVIARRSNWAEIALNGMKEQPATRAAAQEAGGAVGRLTVEQLQEQGLLEELQRKGLYMIRQAIGGYIRDQGLLKVGGLLAKDSKTGGLLSEIDKTGGLFAAEGNSAPEGRPDGAPSEPKSMRKPGRPSARRKWPPRARAGKGKGAAPLRH